MTRLWLWTVTPSTVFSVLCHFVILYMVSIEIVSFCRIISLWNFQYRNHVHSITLMSFQIISQNLVQYKAWLDDVQRLRTVTSLDVSAVAGHHAMPAALLLFLMSRSTLQTLLSCVKRGKPVLLNLLSNLTGTWRRNDVVLTPMRHHVASTSILCRFKVVCLLGMKVRIHDKKFVYIIANKCMAECIYIV